MTTLLLVEDDMDLAGNILDYLALDNFVCDHASNGVAALNLIQTNTYAVVILDINLPRQSGLSVCQTLRQRGDVTPVIMLTARDQLDDKLTGLPQAPMIIWLNLLLWQSSALDYRHWPDGAVIRRKNWAMPA